LLDTRRNERMSMINYHEWLGYQLYLENYGKK